MKFNILYFDGEGATGDAGQAAAVNTGASTTTDAGSNDDVSFDSLVGKDGKYRAEFDKKVQDIVNKRFSKAKAAEERLAKLDPIIATLAGKYGHDAADIDAIAKSVDSDASMFEDQAYNAGMSVEQYRNFVKVQQENSRLKAEREEAEKQHRAQEILDSLNAEAQALKQKYPSFDLDAELQNPTFVNLVRSQVGLEAAYIALHKDEIIPGAMAYTAQAVAKKTADTIAARGARPLEGGISGQAAATIKTDVSKMTKEDRAAVALRAMMGERVSLSR